MRTRSSFLQGTSAFGMALAMVAAPAPAQAQVVVSAGLDEAVLVTGAGKGGSKFTEDPNSLKSTATASVLDLISEGQIRGLVNGDKSIFLNDTPLRQPDGTANFDGVTWGFTPGLPDQDYMPGFQSVVQPASGFSSIATKANQRNTRRITDLNADAVIVTLDVPALNQANTDGSRLEGATVVHQILVKQQADQTNGPAEQLVAVSTITGKNTSSYDEDYRVELPGTGPWDVTVVRTTPDSTSVKLTNATNWGALQLVYDHKFSYPFSALMGITVSAEYFGSSVPSRAYEVYGLIIQVPSNYDPIARSYTGVWDGTFKWAWTNNPAWVFYDLVTNDRYGANIPAIYVDKWSLYQIAMYCDAVTPNGSNMTFQGVPDGSGGTEPRFTYNGVLNQQASVYTVLTSLASAFRGMAFWSAGLVSASQDRPQDPVKIFTPANVIDGSFEYTGTSKQTRHTVAIVSWNNPLNGYKPDFEVVEERQGLIKYGLRSIDVSAFGCTSRGQARRYGKWILATEALETDSVKFKTGFDGADVLPGQIVLVADPAYAGIRMGGRVLAITKKSVQMDAVFNFVSGEEYEVSIMTQSGQMVTAQVANAAGASDTVSFAQNIDNTDLPLVGAIFTLSDVGNVEPRPFQVLSVAESDNDNVYEIFATEHRDEKFDLVDTSAVFDVTAANTFQSLPNPNYTAPPSNLVGALQATTTAYGAISQIAWTWTASPDKLLGGYIFAWQRNNDNWVTAPLQASTSFTIDQVDGAVYQARVYAVNQIGIPSGIISATMNVSSLATTTNAQSLVSGLGLATGGTVFAGTDASFTWAASPISAPTATPSATAFKDQFFAGFQVTVYDPNGVVLRTETVQDAKYTYDLARNAADGLRRSFTLGVKLLGKDGSTSAEAKVSVSNPAPALPAINVQQVATGCILQIVPPSDIDYVGMVVWMSTTTTVDMTQSPVWQGPGNPVLAIPPNGTRYIRYAAYDAFGMTGINLSSVVTVKGTPISLDITDLVAPAVPAGLALASAVITDPATGNQSCRLTATWTANTESDFAQYGVAISVAGGNYVETSTPTNSAMWTVPFNTSVSVKLRAQDKSTNWSNYGAVVTVTTTKDTVAPAAPTTLAATSSLSMIYLSWTNPADLDLEAIDIYENTSNASASATKVGTVNGYPGAGGNWTRVGVAQGQTRYYWLKARDTSGNASGFSAVASVTNVGVGAADFTPGTAPTVTYATVSALPASTGSGKVAFVTADGKLYRDTSTGWTANVPATDITGTIAAAQIAAGVIDATKLAGSITAPQLVSKPNGASTASGGMNDGTVVAPVGGALAYNIADGKLWRNGDGTRLATTWALVNADTSALVGTVSTSQIAAGAIDNTRMASGLVAPVIITSLSQTGLANQLGVYNADGKLYRYIGGAWIKSVDGADILANSITAGTIQAGAIGATQIASGAITTSKLAIVGETLFPDGFIRDQAWWTSTGAQGAAGSQNVAGAWQFNADAVNNGGRAGGPNCWVVNASAYTGTAANIQIIAPRQFGISAGTAYELRATGVNTSNRTNLSLIVQWFDGNGNYISNFGVAIPNDSTIRTVSVQGTAPAGAAAYTFYADLNGTASAFTGYALFGGVSMRQAGTGTLLVDGTIQATKLVAGSITSTQIAASTITGTNIAAGTITASNIATDTITAGQIAASAIGVSELAAGAVTTSKLAVVADNLFPDPQLRDAAFWASGANPYSLGAAAGGTASSWVYVAGGDNNTVVNSANAMRLGSSLGWTGTAQATWQCPAIPGVSGGTIYGISATVYNSSNQTGTVSVRWLNGSSQVGSDMAVGTVAAGTGIKTLSAQLTAPAGATSYFVYFFASGGAAFSGWFIVGNIQVRKANDATLYVAGTITGSALVAGSVTADRLVAGSITATQIAGGTITGDKLVTGTISTTQLAAGAITASKLGVLGDSLFPDGQVVDSAWWSSNPTGKAAGYQNPAGAFYIDTNSAPGVVQNKGSLSAWVTSGGVLNGSTQNGIQLVAPLLAGVIPGEFYEFKSTQFNSSNRPNFSMIVQWFDGTGTYMSGAQGTSCPNDSVSRQLSFQAQAPVGAAMYRVYWEANGSTTGFSGQLYIGGITVRQAGTGTLIVDGSIVASKIAAGTITSDRIAAGTITGDRISSATSLPATLTIGTTGYSLYSGVVATQNATSGGNRVPNSNFAAGTYGWNMNYNGSQITPRYSAGLVNGRRYIKMEGDNWQANTQVSIYSNTDALGLFTVTPGETLSISGKFEGQNISSHLLRVWFYDGSGTPGNQVGTADYTFGPVGTFTTMGFFTTVPAGATLARYELYGTKNGNTGYGSIIICEPMVASAVPGQTLTPAYTPTITADAASIVNANSTLIGAGKIQINGATTVASWIWGGDNTSINGGSIGTNTITANKVVIGVRGVQVIDLAFDTDRNNTLSWSHGFVEWQDEGGNRQVSEINAGSATYQNSGTYCLYVWFDRGNSPGSKTLYASMTDTASILSNTNNVILALYRGGTNSVVYYGRTIIDGDIIKTGTVNADRIVAGTITATQIASGTITGDKIAANTISANQIAAGSISGDRLSAGTITGDRIAGGTITASLIAGGTITGDKIAAGTISADKIGAGTITADRIQTNTLTVGTMAYGTTGECSLYYYSQNNDNSQNDFSAGPLGIGIVPTEGAPILGQFSFTCRSLSSGAVKVLLKVIRTSDGTAVWGGSGGTQISIPVDGTTVSGMFADQVPAGQRAQYDLRVAVQGGGNIRSENRFEFLRELKREHFSEIYIVCPSGTGPGAGSSGGGAAINGGGGTSGTGNTGGGNLGGKSQQP